MTAKDYNRLVQLHADGVYRFILKNMKDEAEAQDIVQDAFEKVWRSKDQVDDAKSKSYLFSVAYHTMIDRLRRSKRQTTLDGSLYENSLSYSMPTDSILETVSRAAEKLPESQKSVVMLRDYEGYSYEEIAEITGLNLSQVKVYIHRARLSMRDYITKLENYYHENK